MIKPASFSKALLLTIAVLTTSEHHPKWCVFKDRCVTTFNSKLCLSSISYRQHCHELYFLWNWPSRSPRFTQ
ncbi:hypothetical protein BJY01DRAFT_226780 [Aspergillus pseudoustus]|uniref:Secreted protein n=1 Tax=Aspergillus pseudoustus TaxID=1810923 RepID=A0ABR4ITI8_9EURO